MKFYNKILFNDLSIEKRLLINKANYSKKLFFQKKVYKNNYFREVDISEYSISLRLHIIRLLYQKKIVSKKFNGDLENLHRYVNDDLKNYDWGTNKLSTFFYDTDKKFKDTYLNLMIFLRKKYLTFDFHYQKIPTVRLPMPGGKNRSHFPHYHSDISLGHPFDMINIWIPLTILHKKDFHSFTMINFPNSKKILKSYKFDLEKFYKHTNEKKQKFNKSFDKYSFKVSTQFGKALFFDSRCFHASQGPMNQTRVSIDARILPYSEFIKSKFFHIGHGRKKAIFVPGKNYSKNIIK